MLHSPELYSAVSYRAKLPYWASMHPFFELRSTLCATLTLWATMHPLSHAAPHSAELYSTELCRIPSELYHTLLSYTTPYWAKLYPPDISPPPIDPNELCYNLFNYAALSDQCCTTRATLHLTERYAAPYRAMCCTSQSYVLHLTELCAAPHRAMLHLTELAAPHRASCTSQS
jgi:hypothetical protein